MDRILRALGDQLEVINAPKTEIAVCGGAGLYVIGAMTRTTTKDVDVFAILDRDGGKVHFRESDPLPEHLRRAADIVAQDYGLSKDWINGGPTNILRFGLPEGLQERMHRRDFGPRLTIHFLDRRDQIFFKLYAAADDVPSSRHMADLKALNPDASELEAAARWTMTHDDSEEFKKLLVGCLKYLGFEDVARRI